ncbi:MAG TPA: hypothetical protein DEQ30_05000 [Porphyromonadaceae bacterium]|nr:hypothetical protein [Porphyromonadaceae bacterium]
MRKMPKSVQHEMEQCPIIHQHIVEQRIVMPEKPTGLVGEKVKYTEAFLKKRDYNPTLPLPDCGYFIITKAEFGYCYSKLTVWVTVTGGIGYPYQHYQEMCYRFPISVLEPFEPVQLHGIRR